MRKKDALAVFGAEARGSSAATAQPSLALTNAAASGGHTAAVSAVCRGREAEPGGHPGQLLGLRAVLRLPAPGRCALGPREEPLCPSSKSPSPT